MLRCREICYFFNMIILIFVSLLGVSLCEESPKYPENTADISSINNLEYKPPIALDPKIRKALLKVLNQLEEQEKTTEIGAVEKSNPEKSESDHKQPSDDVKWEYKSNDTFKQYNYYEIVQDTPSSSPKSTKKPSDSFEGYNYYKIFQDKPSPTSPKPTKKANDTFKEYKYYEIVHSKPASHESTKDKSSATEEPEALFFQVPEHQKEADSGEEKHESLNLQETKSALTADDLFSHLEDEVTKEHKNNDSNDTKSSSKPDSSEEDVEFFQAPLLTAFTLEQDERGLPRRIIPLVDISELSSLLDNKIYIDPTQESRKAREHHTSESSSQNDQKKHQLNIESQLIELQEQKRQLDLEKQKFIIEQEKQKLLIEQEHTRRLKHALELREREHFLRSVKQNEIPRHPEVFLQKSIPLEIHNKPVIIQHAPPFVQYKPYFEFPDTVDRQLQNLFQKSGIHQAKHEDLNIVSKVLALNHNEQEKPKISTERILNIHESFRNKRRLIDNAWRN